VVQAAHLESPDEALQKPFRAQRQTATAYVCVIARDEACKRDSVRSHEQAQQSSSTPDTAQPKRIQHGVRVDLGE
jgi:hypothetical protein